MKASTRWLTILLLAAPALAGELRFDSSVAIIPNCQVQLIDAVDVPAQEAGPLKAIQVKEGDQVAQGSLAAQIDDREAQLQKLTAELERDAAKAKAEDDIEVRYAQKEFELREQELRQDEDINRRSPGTVPTSEIRRKQLERTRAELSIDRSKLNLKVAQMTAQVQDAAVQGAEVSILRRQILAPFDGQVLQVYRQADEWVNAGEPVLHVVRMDRLRVDAFVDGSKYTLPEIANRQVIVEIELARGRREQFSGRVVFVNPVVQAGNKYRMRAEVDNRQEDGQWLLNPGMTATMAIQVGEGSH